MKSNQLLRTYEGEGTVTFDNGQSLTGSVLLTIERNGHCSVTFQIDLSNQMPAFKAVFDSYMRYRSKDEEFIKGKLSGKTIDGAEIMSEWVTIGPMTITGGPGQVQVSEEMLQFVQTGGGLTVTMELLIMSEVHLTYAKLLKPDSIVSSFSGIVNFEFSGCPDRELGRYYIPGELVVRVNAERYEFVKLPEYKEVRDNLTSTKVDVSCEAIIITQFSNLEKRQAVLNDILYLSSFASCNWTTTIYEDIFKNNNLIKTILKPHKTYDYVGGQATIPLVSTKCHLKQFIESAYVPYSKLKKPFILNVLVDYYMQSVRQSNLESRFIMFAVAMETIAACGVDYAKNSGLVIKNNGLEAEMKKLKGIAEKTGVALTNDFIEAFASQFGLNDVKLRDKLRFVFEHFNIVYQEKELKDFTNYRNVVIHSGTSRDLDLLHKQTISIANFFERIILTILGWKGNDYYDRNADYRLVRLP